MTKWKERWDNTYKHDATKLSWQYPNKRKSKGILSLSRGNLTLLIKAITGQNIFAYYNQSKVDYDISKMCRLCEEEEETFIYLITSSS